MNKHLISPTGGAVLLVLLTAWRPSWGQAQGAWVPIIAKQQVTVYQDVPGRGRVLVRDAVGSYLRNRDGSVYERAVTVQGESRPEEETAMLQDARQGRTYLIDYRSRSLRTLKEGKLPLPQPPTDEDFRARHSSWRSLGTKVLGTIECEGYEARPRPGNPEGPTGEMWVAPSLNFLMVESHLVDHVNKAEIFKTLVDIKVGQDPDERFFRPPDGFELKGPLLAPSAK